MNTPAALASGDSTLLFNWNPSRRRKLALGSFLLLSLALHVLGFYLFQVVYPPALALLTPPPSRVSVVSPTTEEGRLLLQWVEAEDPALALNTQRPPEARAFRLPNVEHVASYLTHETELRQLPAYAPDLHPPDPQPPGPVVAPPPPVLGKAIAVTKTALAFSSEAAALGDFVTPDFKFTRSTSEPPQSAEFRAAISSGGEVQYCFLQTSSGDAALDEQAARFITLSRFAKKSSSSDARASAPDEGQNLIWARATVLWGNDLAAAASSAPRVTPAP